jgi:hypothetical protein
LLFALNLDLTRLAPQGYIYQQKHVPEDLDRAKRKALFGAGALSLVPGGDVEAARGTAGGDARDGIGAEATAASTDISLQVGFGDANMMRFRDRMQEQPSNDLLCSLLGFVDGVRDSDQFDGAKASNVRQLHEFLSCMKQSIINNPAWRDMDDTVVSETLEQLLMCHLYERVFAAEPEAVITDAMLHKRMVLLSFVTPGHMDISTRTCEGPDFQRAMRELRRMESYKAPRDKLVCLMCCFNALTGTPTEADRRQGCRFLTCVFSLIDLLRKARKETAPSDAGFINADEILPILIYTCLRAAPEHLHLNLVCCSHSSCCLSCCSSCSSVIGPLACDSASHPVSSQNTCTHLR